MSSYGKEFEVSDFYNFCKRKGKDGCGKNWGVEGWVEIEGMKEDNINGSCCNSNKLGP